VAFALPIKPSFRPQVFSLLVFRFSPPSHLGGVSKQLADAQLPAGVKPRQLLFGLIEMLIPARALLCMERNRMLNCSKLLSKLMVSVLTLDG